MPTRNVNLTDHHDTFIEGSIAEGRFANAGEAVRAGLGLLERQVVEDKTRPSWLRAATEEAFAALDRGEGVQLNSADDIDVFVDRVLRKRRAARADLLPAFGQDIDDILGPDPPGIARRAAIKTGAKAELNQPLDQEMR